MRKLLFILLFLPLSLFGQEVEKVPAPSAILKLSPFSLIDPLSSVQFALEYQLKGRSSLQHELGYITRTLYWSEDYKSPRGLRLRNEYRFYFDEGPTALSGFYFAPELVYIFLRYEREGRYGRGCGPFLDCDYYQLMDYTVQKQVFAVHPKVGFQSIYKRLVVDVYAGLGYRHVRVKNIDEPPAGWGNDEMFEIRKAAGIYNLPSISFGFKFGYILSGTEP